MVAEAIQSFYDKLSPAAVVIIVIAIMLFGGFLMTRLTKLLKLPNVTAYLIVGILLGPQLLGLIPKTFVDNSAFLSDIAIVFIGFISGQYLTLSVIKKSGYKIAILTLCEALLSTILVFCIMRYALRLSLELSIIVAAIASCTTPTSTLMTIRQTKSSGKYVETLIQVVGLDNILALLIFSIAISVSMSRLGGSGSVNAWEIIKPILFNLASIAIGIGLGFLLKVLMPDSRTRDNKLIILISFLLGFAGICRLFEYLAGSAVSPLLGAMMMGIVFNNISKDQKLFRQINYFSPPIMCLFFVRSGANLNVVSLFNGMRVGELGILVIVVVLLYVLVRIIGKYIGCFAGSAITKENKNIRNYLGLALIPQTSVAIALATSTSDLLHGIGTSEAIDIAVAVETIIIASSVIYEIIGPMMAKLGLHLSKSIPSEFDDFLSKKEKERLKKDEKAFIQGAEEAKHDQ